MAVGRNEERKEINERKMVIMMFFFFFFVGESGWRIVISLKVLLALLDVAVSTSHRLIFSTHTNWRPPLGPSLSLSLSLSLLHHHSLPLSFTVTDSLLSYTESCSVLLYPFFQGSSPQKKSKNVLNNLTDFHVVVRY